MVAPHLNDVVGEIRLVLLEVVALSVMVYVVVVVIVLEKREEGEVHREVDKNQPPGGWWVELVEGVWPVVGVVYLAMVDQPEKIPNHRKGI